MRALLAFHLLFLLHRDCEVVAFNVLQDALVFLAVGVEHLTDDVGGKTGTSEKTDTFDENGKMVEDKIVSFVGVAPINDPQYVVLVALDTPKYQEDNTKYTPNGYYISGGLMAAPTVRDIFLDILPYLGVEPDYASGEIRGVNVKMPELTGMTQEEAAAALKNKTR